jgi:hypothetical protein
MASSESDPSDACPVAITVAISGTGLVRELVVHADNRDTGVQELVLPDRCPNGPVELSGLPAGYDYYGTCAMGACLGDRPPLHIGLGVGERRELSRTSLELGASTCNAPVPAGEYLVSAVVAGVDAACITGATLIVGGSTTDTPPQPTPQPTPQPKPSGADIDFRACTADSECIVHCPRVDRCCGWPCGCNNAINKAHQAAFDAQYARTCTKAPDCPAMGCAYEPHYSARCIDKRCRSFAGVGF